MIPFMAVDLADLIMLAQDHTWVMVLLVWITLLVAGKLLSDQIEENSSDIDDLASCQNEMQQEVRVIDTKQNHIVERQEMVMETVGVNEQEIQDLRQETTRLDAEIPERDDRWRGNAGTGD